MCKNNILNFDECVKYALTVKRLKGESLKDTGLRVFTRHTANPDTVFKVLWKKGIVIPVVKASLFNENNSGETATVVIKANQVTDMVELYDPMTNEVREVTIAAFVEAWDATGGVCTTAFPDDPKTYYPKLRNLSQVELPEGYDELREAIAENAHDRWALERQSEGWTYGYKRDDSNLQTPDMVPYSQLPESEKKYDRIMAEDTLKFLISLGYKIERNDR